MLPIPKIETEITAACEKCGATIYLNAKVRYDGTLVELEPDRKVIRQRGVPMHHADCGGLIKLLWDQALVETSLT